MYMYMHIYIYMNTFIHIYIYMSLPIRPRPSTPRASSTLFPPSCTPETPTPPVSPQYSTLTIHFLLLHYCRAASRVMQKSMSLEYEPFSEPLHI